MSLHQSLDEGGSNGWALSELSWVGKTIEITGRF